MPDTTQWHFADFRLDSSNKCLWRGTTVVKLKPRTFDVLCFLVERAGQLVTRAELFAAFWAETYVSETALTNCLSELRKALDDTSKPARFIETVPTRGYRFITKVVGSQYSVVSSGERSGVRRPQPVLGVVEGPEVKNSQSAIRIPHSAIPLVGRDTELTQLHSWLERARNGERQIVFVTGEPGIGKTALVETFLRGIGRWELGSGSPPPQSQNPQSQIPNPGLWVARGQCVKQYGADEAYLPVFEALEHLVKGEHGEQVLAGLRHYAPTWLVQMPGCLSPSDLSLLRPRVVGATRERMLREIAEAIEVLTREQVLVLWFDDIHDSDPSTLELITYLARRREPARFLLIGSYRPAEVLTGEHPLRRVRQEFRERRQWQELALRGLDVSSVGDYLTLCFPGAADISVPELANVIHRRTEGHPLFLLSILEDLQAQQLLVRNQQRWRLRVSPQELASRVPTTLLATLEGQIHNLQPQEQEVLQAGSVAGIHFTVPVVSTVTGRSALEVEDICERLARGAHFIQRDGTEEWPDTTLATRYRFRHALHHDVAYVCLPPMKRSDWHLKIGERREKAFATGTRPIATELAVHFEQGRNFHKAVLYLTQAGENAVQRGAHQEAVSQLSKGLILLAQWPDGAGRNGQELRILTTLGPALMALKGYGALEVENVYARAQELCRRLGETPQLLPVLGGLWVFYQVRARLRNARKLAEQIVALANGLGKPAALMYPHLWLGQTLFSLGELQSGRAHLEQSLTLYDPQQDSPRATVSPQDPGETGLAYVSWALWLSGYPDQAFERSQRALALSETLNHPQSRAHALHFTAWLYHARKEPQAVLECTAVARRMLGEGGSSYRLAQGVILSGWALVKQGQGAKGIALMREGLSAWEASGAEALMPCYLALLAEAYHQAGHAAAGLDTIQLAIEYVNNTEERWYEAEIYRLYGELLLRRGERATGRTAEGDKITHSSPEEYILKAIGIARQQQARSLELRATISLVRLRQRQTAADALRTTHRGSRNKLAEAHRMLFDLYSWFTEGFGTADLQEAKILLEELG